MTLAVPVALVTLAVMIGFVVYLIRNSPDA